MLSHQTLHPFSPPPFRLAIFICGSSALSVSEVDGTWSKVDPRQLEEDRKRIRIRTVHIYGRKDKFYSESSNLRDMCVPSGRVEFDHEAGHEIPRGVGVTAQMARAVHKGIDRALAAH